MRSDLKCENVNDLLLEEVEITPKEYENILKLQASILKKVTLNHKYEDVLSELCLLTEQLLPNSVASIMLLNNETKLMSVLSAPSMPEGGKKALENLQPGPHGGSCGSALFYKKPQYVLNTFEDQRWLNLKKVAIDFNLCSCWSMPIKNEKNEYIGTFALSSFEHRLPAPFHKKLLETAAFIVNIVLKNKEIETKLHQMLYYDSLTNLYNKTHLEETLATEGEHTLILLDINNFSYINSTYGFEFGDKILIKIAEIFKQTLHFEQFFRLNSDEFAIIFNDKVDIVHNVKNIQDYFYETALIVDGVTLNITFSFGAASGENDLFKDAVIALKESQQIGKNSLQIFNSAQEEISYKKRKSFIDANNMLHNALQNEQLVPFFQGIRDNTSGEISRYEVLARIQNQDEIISPFVFIEPAKLSGLLPDITKIMIDKSFKIMSKYRYKFSINITEDDLSRDYIIKYLDEKSKLYDINPNRVTLEILEGISAQGKESHLLQLSNLKKRGYFIAIDDFGTEYSNFERVLDLDIDFIKIDAKYIKDIDTNPKSYEITKAIVYFAKNAKISCIAEFVHNKNVQDVMRELRIEYSQGYFFSEPSRVPISSTP